MDDDADDLGQAVAGFRRAEAALAAIAADADRLVDARVEVEQARDELKVVAGALVGLATAHRDLVGQLGEAASALRPAERGDEGRLVVALREAEVVRARQALEVADAVEELAHRLDRALAERIGGVVAELTETVAGLARSDQVSALAQRLDQLERAEPPADLQWLTDRLDRLATADQVAALANGPAHQGDFPWLVERLDVIDRLPDAEQLVAVQELLSTLAESVDLARLDELASTSDLQAMERRMVENLAETRSPAPELVAEAATSAARAVEAQVAELIEQVHAGQRRVHQMVLAMAVAFLLFAALVSVLALR